MAAENKSVVGQALNSNPESGAPEVQSHAHTQGRSELGQRGDGYANLVKQLTPSLNSFCAKQVVSLISFNFYNQSRE